MMRLVAFLTALLLPLAAFAQGAVQQSGPVTSGHIATWTQDHVVQDGGPSPTAAPVSASQPVSVLNFAADPTGIADSTVNVQNAINAMCSAGGTLVFPPGVYKIHDINIGAACGAIHVVGFGKGGTTAADTGIAQGPNSTVLNCSAMTDHCIQWGANSATPAANRSVGGSVEHLSTYNSGGSGVVFRMHQQVGARVTDIWMAAPPHALEFYGNENTYIDWVDIRNASADPAVEVWGNLAGKAASGAACTLGDCSTRQDLTVFKSVNGYGAAAGFLYVHDQTFGTDGSFATWEGGLYGIKVRCAAGQANLGGCPQQLRWFDFENEYGTLPLDLQDFTFFMCSHCYFAGIAAGGSTHVGVASLANYTATAGGGGGFYLDNSTVYGANGSCLLLGVTDVHLDHNAVYGCNLSGNALGTNDAAVELNDAGGAVGSNDIISNNNFCSSLGGGGTANELGVLIGANSSRVALTSNSYFACIQNKKNNSSSPATVVEANAFPPPSFGSLSGISGCGSTCTVAAYSANQLGGSILLTPGGTGIAATGSFTLNFSGGSSTQNMPEPLYPQALCWFMLQQGGTGSWVSNATAAVTTPATTSLGVTWSNGSTVLTSGSGYFIDYRCGGY
jgi:hypothetical protein